MNGFEALIISCNENIVIFSQVIRDLRVIIYNQELIVKEMNKLGIQHQGIDFDEIEQFSNYTGYIIISILELSVISKNSCLVNTDWERAFFIKNGFLQIHETINKLKPQKGVSYVQQKIDSKYPLLRDRFHLILNQIEEFKENHDYKKIENSRHYIAGHIEKSFKKYYDTVFDLDGEEAAKITIRFLKILEDMQILMNEYTVYIMQMQKELTKCLIEEEDRTSNLLHSKIQELLNLKGITSKGES